MRLVLASASPARLGVLRAAGLDPIVVVSEVDEEAVLAQLPNASPSTATTELALAKAKAVASRVAAEHPEAVVLGCDSMLSINGALVGKPGSPEAARARWAAIAGQAGKLITGHAALRLTGGTVTKTATGAATTVVRFGRPTKAELAAYIDSGEPLSVAGGFTLDGLGGWFIEGIDGDPSNVIGISLPLTRALLAKLGLVVTDLWRPRPAASSSTPSP